MNLEKSDAKLSLLEAYKHASAVRSFEIESFWQRSLFFWGFVAASFVAYGSSYNSPGYFGSMIAAFGLVCSAAWSLQNRGSKYWQEAWEQKVSRLEGQVTSENIFRGEERSEMKGPWSGIRYSPSQLAIALSDFSALTWVCLFFQQMHLRLSAPVDCYRLAIFAGCSVYCLVMIASPVLFHRDRPVAS